MEEIIEIIKSIIELQNDETVFAKFNIPIMGGEFIEAEFCIN